MRDRNAGERGGRIARQARIGGSGLLQAKRRVDVQESVQITLGDTRQMPLREFGGRDFFRLQQVGKFFDGLGMHGVPATIFRSGYSRIAAPG